MGVLHYLGLVDHHKGIFNDISILDAITALESSYVSDFKKIITSLFRYYNNDYTMEGFEYFIPGKDSPIIIKDVGTSQYTDGVRIDKKYQYVLNPIDSKYYTERGSARKIKVLFNNKVFDAEYIYEG